MNYERKTVKIYPYDNFKAKVIEAYKAGGWEAETPNDPNTSNEPNASFIFLTFKRNKNMPNYDKVKSASATLEKLLNVCTPTSSNSTAYILGKFFLFLTFALFINGIFAKILLLGAVICGAISGTLLFLCYYKTNKRNSCFELKYQSELDKLKRFVKFLD